MTDAQAKQLLSINAPQDITHLSIVAVIAIGDPYSESCAIINVNGIEVNIFHSMDICFLSFWDESPRAFRMLRQSIRYSCLLALESNASMEPSIRNLVQQLNQEFETYCGNTQQFIQSVHNRFQLIDADDM